MTYPSPGQPYPPNPDAQQYPQEHSYTTEPPASGLPYQGGGYDQGYAPAPQYPVPSQYPAGPQYGQPAAYQQPAYQQPGYQQGYGQPQAYAQPAQLAPPSPPRRNAGGMMALVIGSVVILLVVVGVGAALLLRSGDEDSPANQAVTPPASATATQPAEYPASIELPQKLAGMTKVDDADLNKIANEIADDLKSGSNADSAVAAYYAPGGDLTKIVGVIGSTGKMTSPASELDEMFGKMTITNIQAIDPGPMAGHMKCGTQLSGSNSLTICGWADAGSLGLGIFLERPMSESETLFRQIRSEVLKRG